MSGHSHWASIKHQKGIADVKKGKAFSKVIRLITLAAKTGPNPETNPKLRMAVEQAKSLNMPKDNIEKAIKRGNGQSENENLEEVVFEGFGPAGVTVIVEGITDNKNRTLAEIKQIFNQNKGKLANEGSVKWMFERKGVITINPLPAEGLPQGDKIPKKENLELKAIEAGAEDVFWDDDLLDVYTKAEDLERVKKNLEEKGLKIESASLDWQAKETIKVNEEDKTACQKLFEALDENDAVQDIYSNLKT